MMEVQPLLKRWLLPVLLLVPYLLAALQGCATLGTGIRAMAEGTKQYREKNYRAGKKAWGKALHFYRNTRQHEKESVIRGLMAKVTVDLGQYEESLKHAFVAAYIHSKQGRRKGFARSLLHMALAYRRLGYQEESLHFSKNARKIFGKLGDEKGRAQANYQMGLSFLAVENYRSARRALKNAEEGFQKVSDKRGHILALSKLAYASYKVGNHQDGTRQADEAARLSSRVNDSRVVASVLVAVGLVRRGERRYQDAIRTLKRSLELYRSAGDSFGVSTAQEELAHTHLQMRQFSQARSLYQKVLKQFRAARDEAGESKGLVFLGNADVVEGRYASALALYQKSYDLKKKIRDQVGLGNVLTNQGAVFDLLGDRAKAKKAFQEALEIHEAIGDKKGKAYDLTSLALISRAEGDIAKARGSQEEASGIYAKALGNLKNALEIYRQLEDAVGEGYAATNMGIIFDSQGDYRQAITQYQNALALKKKGRDEVGEARALLNIGLAHNMLRDYPRALEFIDKAIKLGGKTPEIAWRAFFARGAVLENLSIVQEGDSSRLARTAKEYKRSIQVIEDVRVRQEKGTFKADFFEGKVFVYEAIIRLLFDENRFEEALHYVERSKARAFLDLLASRDVGGGVSGSPLETEKIRGLVSQGSALVEYYLTSNEAYAFLILPDRVRGVRLPTSTKDIVRRVIDFRDQAVEKVSLKKLQRNAYKEVLRKLYADLILPLKSHLAGVRHITFVPHGVLHYLPFHALIRGNRYLIEEFAVAYTPSASILALAKAKIRPGQKGTRLLTVGNPKTDLGALPESEIEAREVSRVWGLATKGSSETLIGTQATETRVKALMRSSDVILLATHGELLPKSPLQSNLRFTPSENDDGKLTVSEIFSLNLQADLVVLSACETAVVAAYKGGQISKGDEFQGLSRAFIAAGAPSVVATLWKVSDESTGRLMKEFFKLLPEKGKAGALRTAMLSAIHRDIQLTPQRGVGGVVLSTGQQVSVKISGEHPYFWAPFVLVGAWN